jgi:hypothetical protein
VIVIRPVSSFTVVTIFLEMDFKAALSLSVKRFESPPSLAFGTGESDINFPIAPFNVQGSHRV